MEITKKIVRKIPTVLMGIFFTSLQSYKTHLGTERMTPEASEFLETWEEERAGRAGRDYVDDVCTIFF